MKATLSVCRDGRNRRDVLVEVHEDGIYLNEIKILSTAYFNDLEEALEHAQRLLSRYDLSS